MRELTEAGVLFSFEYLSYQSDTDNSNGYKRVVNAILRMGYRDNQSDKASILVGYKTVDGRNRWFYLPLLTRFNDYIIKA
jgi:hypothetical protein